MFTCFFTQLFAQRSEHHLDFLRRQDKTAKEYVIDLFKEHDIVVLCERSHPEFTQYELILDIITDPWFVENVGHIYTELGMYNMDERINRFLMSDETDSVKNRQAVTDILRDVNWQSYWHCTSYPWLLTEVQKFNRTQPDERKIAWHPVDEALVWEEMQTIEQFREFAEFQKFNGNRDSMMAVHFADKFEQIEASGSPRKKGLLIENYKHAFMKKHRFVGKWTTSNTAQELYDRYGDRLASVYIMGLAIPRGGDYNIVKEGLWNYFMRMADKEDIGFDLKGSPFGTEHFDVIMVDSLLNFLYQDMFTGLICYKPLEQHIWKNGWEDYITPEFRPEFARRIRFMMEVIGRDTSDEAIDQIINWLNTEASSPAEGLEKYMQMINHWGSKPPADWENYNY